MSWNRKFSLADHVIFSHHRSGWADAMRALEPLMRYDGKGTLLDATVEMTFVRELPRTRRQQLVPYRRPWVGFVHCPPRIPRWHLHRYSPSYYFRLKTWQDSMPYCQGLVTFSDSMASWLRKRVEVPVLSVKHPTNAESALRFDFGRYQVSSKRRVVQVGWWLRRLCSIELLPVRAIRKAILLPANDEFMRGVVYSQLERERQKVGVPPLEKWDAELLPYQPADAYDRLLASSIVLLDLYDSVANNALIECMVRHTPVLVNPLPSVLEYLGLDYPLYFETLAEAARKAEDLRLVGAAHRYLKKLPKHDLTGGSFLRGIADSKLYSGLQ